MAVEEEQHTFLPSSELITLAAYVLEEVPLVEHLRALDLILVRSFVFVNDFMCFIFRCTVYSFIMKESNLVVLVAHHNSDKNSFYR